MDKRWAFVAIVALVGGAAAQDSLTSMNGYNDTDGSFSSDPILQYRPHFAESLPVQLLMTGIVLTLTSVLLIHLLFTAQYHWPLAPVNYALQLSAVCTLLTSLIATLHVVLEASTNESQQWPYMLNYLAVDIPPLRWGDGWTSGELAAWLLMNATTSALIQITHIQFLTLLFPSTLERRLIFVLLGPLAIVAAIMQLVPLNDSTTNGQLTSIATATQNVCNATLSLLFTASLFIWGFLVNRKQAWRTDGGTAAFGVGAMVLAVGSTTITFIYIPSKDHYAWMPGLMWAVILWQSFLGWWWWVGSGMGVGEVDERLRKEEKRRRKRKAKLEKRELRKGKAELFWKNVAGAVGYGGRNDTEQPGLVSRCSSTTDEQRPRSRLSRTASHQSSPTSSHTHTFSSASETPSGFLGRVSNHVVVRSMYGWFLSLRQEHLMAAREQAVVQTERMQQVYGHEREPGAAIENPDPSMLGWGLGAYAVRRAEVDERERDYEAEQGILEVERDEARFAEGEGMDSRSEKQQSPVLTTQQQQELDERIQARRRRNRHARHDTDEPNVPIEDAENEHNGRQSSMWYWGPLGRWRLQDSTVYS